MCFANGKYRKGGLQFTLIEGFRGSTWIIRGPATRLEFRVGQHGPVLRQHDGLHGRVGGDYNGGGRARWWNGSTWKGTTLAGPSGAPLCPRHPVGFLRDRDVLHRGRRADQRRPAHPGAPHRALGRPHLDPHGQRAAGLPGHAALGGVSCTAAWDCTAVGFRQPGTAPFAEARTGPGAAPR